MKPPYKSSSTSGVETFGRLKSAGQIALISGSALAFSAFAKAVSKSIFHFAAISSVSVFSFFTTIGDLFK